MSKSANPTLPRVDIVIEGFSKLVYINGHRINGVLDIELPNKQGEIGPQIVLRIVADEIVQRTVSTCGLNSMPSA